MATSHYPGQRLSFEKVLCTVRYVGEVAGTKGAWLGVEWDDPTRGKHNGSHAGTEYFTCLSKSPTAASFVRPTRPADPAQSFISALRDKYASEGAKDAGPKIAFSGKIVEEVGFEKVQRQLAKVEDLKIVILDGSCVAFPVGKGQATIRKTCPRITDLDLSRNLLERLGGVVDICGELQHLRALRLNGNRFQAIFEDKKLEGSASAFDGVKELALEETLLTWDETLHIATKFLALTSLNAGSNQLSSLSSPSFGSLISTLTSLNLEFNNFTSFADLSSLTTLTSLRNLHLKGNGISNISTCETPHPVFPPSLQYLDISYNSVATWSFVDALPDVFPGMTALRLTHNPIYDKPDPDNVLDGKALTDEAFTIAVGRLACLRTLNFVAVTPTDRANAELFYLSRIAKHLAQVPEAAAAGVIARHRRYAELCEIHGEPNVVRAGADVNPNFLEARLVAVTFRYQPAGAAGTGEGEAGPAAAAAQKTVRVPKSFDVYAVKGVAGRLFGLPPRKVRLVWETGEWDPVAGFDDGTGNSSDEEEAEAEQERGGGGGAGSAENYGVAWRTGGFVKRQVELGDGPRQLGFCVDGLEAKIRVELRK